MGDVASTVTRNYVSNQGYDVPSRPTTQITSIHINLSRIAGIQSVMNKGLTAVILLAVHFRFHALGYRTQCPAPRLITMSGPNGRFPWLFETCCVTASCHSRRRIRLGSDPEPRGYKHESTSFMSISLRMDPQHILYISLCITSLQRL
jgi:hypothetical protein